MKTLLSILLVASLVLAAAPANKVSDNIYTNQRVTVVSASNALDTLVGSDSVRIIDNLTPKRGSEYILAIAALTGGTVTGDSLSVQVLAKAYDANDSLITSVSIDTLSVEDFGEYVYLPFNETLFGDHYDIYLKELNSGTVETILNVMQLYERRAESFNGLR